MMPDAGDWGFLLPLLLIIGFILLIGAFWWGLKSSQRSKSLSPYTGLPLRKASELPYYSAERAIRFMSGIRQYDNPVFSLKQAGFCRETGRLFPNCLTIWGSIDIDWNFLQKRYPGVYVSWGSLNKEQREELRYAHEYQLEGFQTAFSSPTPSPRAIEPEYAYSKPGPLYVDLETKVLLGWKQIPETFLEVLIVQKPIR